MDWLRRREKALFRTHTPPFQTGEWTVGQVVQHEGGVYQVTRWVELRPVLIERGGTVGEWEIWGRRLSGREMRRALLDAVERIKSGEDDL